ncbi:MAG TPA: cytochrome b N-terminal domain-containing protein [Chloroflexota bacterium]|nr:cytochrome b N-terminal domain-containing protein [Chloroflexota bacterium]
MAANRIPLPHLPKHIWLTIGGWFEDRSHIYEGLLPIVQHPVPNTGKSGWWYVFGSATLTAFVIQVVTGVALAMTYSAAPSVAYDTLQFISHSAPFGSLLRGMHYFGASAMVVLISIHVLRIFLMGSYKFPREFNWLTGAFLLVLTAAIAFTGQLLRWDQDGYWSIVVMAEQAGKTPVVGQLVAQLVVAGSTVGGATLTRFFGIHVFLLPAMIGGFILIHLWLVIFDGISEPPVPGVTVDPKTYKQRYHALLERDGVPFFPDAAWRDALFAGIVVAVIMILAAVIGAPELGKPADPTIIQANPRPDWYFLWYFTVLSLIPPALENWVILTVPVLIGVLVVAVPFVSRGGERHPARRPLAVFAVGAMLIGLAVLTIQGSQAHWSPDIQAAQNAPIPPDILQQAQAQNAAPGAQLFQAKGCRTCHSLAGTGGQRGPDLTYVGNRLTREELITRILNGGNNMPAFGGNITDQQLQQLVNFLQTLKTPSQGRA